MQFLMIDFSKVEWMCFFQQFLQTIFCVLKRQDSQWCTNIVQCLVDVH